MEDSEALLYLLALFPHKTERYLNRQLRKHNHNLTATMEGIQNDVSEETNGFRKFFRNVFGIFCCGVSNGEDNSRTDTDVVDVNIGEEFAASLVAKFADSDLVLPTGFQPVIEIPVALGRQLYVAYVQSVFRQQEAYNEVVENLVKEDEEFAKKLEDEEHLKYYRGESSGIRKATAQGRRILQDDKFRKIYCVKKGRNESVEDVIDIAFDDENLENLQKPAKYYRDQAHRHFLKRKEIYRLANECLQANSKREAQFYFQKAKQETRLIDQANKHAAQAFLIENSRNRGADTIDLHHLYVKEAIEALDKFLDRQILTLKDHKLRTKVLTVITGRGKHSLDGIPKIKPAVIGRLQERSLKHTELNPGLLRVQISSHSCLMNKR